MNNNILHKLFLTLTLVLLTLGASAQVTVSGNVSDESGEPIIGATVMEALTTNGVVTDFDGNFVLQVSSSAKKIKVSYIGYIDKILAISENMKVKEMSSEKMPIVN